MNDKDKEAFDKWWQNIYDSYIEFRDWQGCDITFDKKEDMRIGWQAACEHKQKEIEKFIKDHPPELTEEQYNKLIKDWADDLIKKLEGEK